jgi:PhnB protein
MANMAKRVKAKPDQYHTLTASLAVKGADSAIEWYSKVFGAKLISRMGTPDGKAVWHAELQIGDSLLMLNDEMPSMGQSSSATADQATSAIHAYVEDVDGLYKRALAAGAKSNSPPNDMFWGDRYAQFVDPFGHLWSIATHTEDVPPDQMEARGREWVAKMATSQH